VASVPNADSARQEVDALTLEVPKRWHVEKFFNTGQALGWERVGTCVCYPVAGFGDVLKEICNIYNKYK
jgi:hypothetical protein